MRFLIARRCGSLPSRWLVGGSLIVGALFVGALLAASRTPSHANEPTISPSTRSNPARSNSTPSNPAQDDRPFQRLEYRNSDRVVDLGVGLWAWPMPVDYDHDGDVDLLVSCPDKPFNGTYWFENSGRFETPTSSAAQAPALPIFEPPVRIAEGRTNAFPSYVGETLEVLTPDRIFRDFAATTWTAGEPLGLPMDQIAKGRLRHVQWKLADLNADGRRDLIIGVEDWTDYGWDDGYDAEGKWLKGPLRGRLYFVANDGSEEAPHWHPPVLLTTDNDSPIETAGIPSPNLVDWDHDGDLDLLCGEFLDGFTYFQNIGDANVPKFAPGVRLLDEQGEPLRMHVQMIIPVAFDWDRDGDFDLIVGDEDGRVAWIECLQLDAAGVPQFRAPHYFQQRAHDLKFGALATPTGCDWDGDGDDDLLCGNTAGEIAWFENLDGGNPPQWAPARLLHIDQVPLRIQAGPNGSIQGPIEAKWGYTTLTTGDWDHDGHMDVVFNSIWGKVEWCRRVPGDDPCRVEAPASVLVQWNGEPPKPAWNWWQPDAMELVTQWRTTPCVVDWNQDGLLDLVMLDAEGYLAWFERVRSGDQLRLTSGQRIFVTSGDARFDSGGKPVESTERDGSLQPLQLNVGQRGASGRRKLHWVDWNQDGNLDLLTNSVNASWWEGAPTADGKYLLTARGNLSSMSISGHTTSPTTVDFDHDGRPELLIGAEDGRMYYLPNLEMPDATTDR